MTYRRKTLNEQGFFTIWTLGLCVILFFVGGLAVDIWKSFSDRRQLAEIADAASIAGASRIDLACFRDDGNAVLKAPDDDCPTELARPQDDPETAVERANAYIDYAIAEDNITLTDRNAVIEDGALQVTLTRESNTTLTRILSPTQSYTVTVHSAASPTVARP